MTRISHRIVRALLALWLAVLTVEPSRVHACPMHDGLAMAPTGPHAGHAAHGSHQAPESKHACSCIGACSMALGPVPTPVAILDVATVAGTRTGIPEHLRAIVATAHANPFANGPPLS